jgi:hypothetical protein
MKARILAAAILAVCAAMAMYMTVQNARGPQMFKVCWINSDTWGGLCEPQTMSQFTDYGYTPDSWERHANEEFPGTYTWVEKIKP